MTLIPCKECGAQISDAAPVCPRCGVVQPGLSKAGKLVISRKARVSGSMHSVQVIVDGKQVGEMKGEGYSLTLDLAPGKRVVEVGGGGLSRRIEVTIVEGEVLRYQMYFSVWGVLGGGLQLRPE